MITQQKGPLVYELAHEDTLSHLHRLRILDRSLLKDWPVVSDEYLMSGMTSTTYLKGQSSDES